MITPGIYSAARALSYWERVADVTAANLANTDTDAFKAIRITASLQPWYRAPYPVSSIDLSQGALQVTGRPLDVALEGDGFLVVSTPEGERLFRGGQLRLDATGLLVDAHGDPVLGENGPIVTAGSEIEITADGTVVVDGRVADRLRIVVADPTGLQKVGAGRFVADPGTIAVADPALVRVHQGALEQANIDAIEAMVDMIQAQRAYQANINVMHALDDALGVLTGQVGRVR